MQMEDYIYVVTDSSKVSYGRFYTLHISYGMWYSLEPNKPTDCAKSMIDYVIYTFI